MLRSRALVPAHAVWYDRGVTGRLSSLGRGALLLATLLATGCPPKGLQLAGSTTPTFQTGAVQREMRSLTDLDTVRDVANHLETHYVATDRGLLVYREGSRPERITTVGEDVWAVSVNPQGDPVVASAQGVFVLSGPQPTSTLPAAPVGTVRALHVDLDGTLWACGDLGLVRVRSGGSWEGYGEQAQCTGLWPTPEGRLWVGTTRGLWYLDADDVIREHGEGRGIPAGWVRSVVPGQPGEAFVLVQNNSESHLGWFDGARWYDYTIPDLDPVAVALGRRGSDAILVTPQHAFVIQDAARASGVALRPLGRGERSRVLSYRARITEGGHPIDGEPAAARPASRLAAVPANAPTIEAPGFVVSPLGRTGDATYFAKQLGGALYVANRNQGVQLFDSTGVGARFRSQDLVAENDLQLVSDERGNSWLITDEGVIGRMRDGVLQRIDSPEGAGTCGAIASARRGVYVACHRGQVVSVLRWASDRWELAARRVLFGGAPASAETAAPEGAPASPDAATSAAGVTLIGTPLLGVTDDETFWVALRVEQNGQPRARGVAVFAGEDGPVVYHHSQSDPATDGEGALRLIDQIDNMDLNESGMAWFSTLSGAVRIGNHQAVVFGEARGVRGEVVSDVLVGGEGRVWVAAAEGPGYYFNRSFEFRMPAAVRAARPLRLALDVNGDVWGAGPNGLVHFDGENWAVHGGEESGLPTTQFVDIEGDAAGRLWLLARDQVLVLGRPQRAAAPE